LIACDSTDENIVQSDSTENSVNKLNRTFRPVVLGEKKNNPYTVENMLAALDTLKAYPNELDGCLKSPSLINDIDISTTDYYVRFLPQDSVQFTQLKNDTMLTLFDFPLDYEIVQTGEYYHDPTVSGPYTWLYTRVPKDYDFPGNIRYEILEELFIVENSPYYSSEIVNDSSALKVRTSKAQGTTDLLKTIEAISFFNSGYQYGKSVKPTTGNQQKIKRLVEKTFLWRTWYEYEYYPSGTIQVQSYHDIGNTGSIKNYSTLTAVPLKGAKVFMWDGFFKWNSAYTNSTGYYESDISYNNDLYYYLHFTGANGANSWNLDRVTLGAVCLWVQKMSLNPDNNRQSNDVFNAVVQTTSSGWDACITNNAFYEYMTICDKHGITRPPANLKVALLEMSGSSSAPLLQNHLNTYGAGLTTGLATMAIIFPGTAVVTVPLTLLSGVIASASPDIILAGGNIEKYQTDSKWLLSQKSAINEYTTTIWHELSHSSNFQRVYNDKGYTNVSLYWSSLVGTEATSFTLGNGYGSKGDINWEQVALCEGWANFCEYKFGIAYLVYGRISSSYPRNYAKLFKELELIGCSLKNMEKCLTSKTISEYKQNLINLYPSLTNQIKSIISSYE
jgi:hypothetical protein